MGQILELTDWTRRLAAGSAEIVASHDNFRRAVSI
jgi:hypothetical protein